LKELISQELSSSQNNEQPEFNSENIISAM
jgi:hypothetical protein